MALETSLLFPCSSPYPSLRGLEKDHKTMLFSLGRHSSGLLPDSDTLWSCGRSQGQGHIPRWDYQILFLPKLSPGHNREDPSLCVRRLSSENVRLTGGSGPEDRDSSHSGKSNCYAEWCAGRWKGFLTSSVTSQVQSDPDQGDLGF